MPAAPKSDALRVSDLLVKTVALEVGYRQTSDLTHAMVARFGASPTQLRATAGRG
jgi:AraC-like DNA-binding protein